MLEQRLSTWWLMRCCDWLSESVDGCDWLSEYVRQNPLPSYSDCTPSVAFIFATFQKVVCHFGSFVFCFSGLWVVKEHHHGLHTRYSTTACSRLRAKVKQAAFNLGVFLFMCACVFFKNWSSARSSVRERRSRFLSWRTSPDWFWCSPKTRSPLGMRRGKTRWRARLPSLTKRRAPCSSCYRNLVKTWVQVFVVDHSKATPRLTCGQEQLYHAHPKASFPHAQKY